MEDHFGSKREVPEKFEAAVRKGEKEIDDRKDVEDGRQGVMVGCR